MNLPSDWRWIVRPAEHLLDFWTRILIVQSHCLVVGHDFCLFQFTNKRFHFLTQWFFHVSSSTMELQLFFSFRLSVGTKSNDKKYNPGYRHTKESSYRTDVINDSVSTKLHLQPSSAVAKLGKTTDVDFKQKSELGQTRIWMRDNENSRSTGKHSRSLYRVESLIATAEQRNKPTEEMSERGKNIYVGIERRVARENIYCKEYASTVSTVCTSGEWSTNGLQLHVHTISLRKSSALSIITRRCSRTNSTQCHLVVLGINLLRDCSIARSFISGNFYVQLIHLNIRKKSQMFERNFRFICFLYRPQ